MAARAFITGTFTALRFKLTRSLSGKKVVVTPVVTSELDHSQTSDSLPDIPIVQILKCILQLCDSVADVTPYPGIKLVTNGLLTLLEQYEITGDNIKKIENLTLMLGRLRGIISCCKETLPKEVSERLGQLSIQMLSTEEDIAELLRKRAKQWFGWRIFSAASDAKAIGEFAAKITDMINVIMFQAALDTAANVNKFTAQINVIEPKVDFLHRQGVLSVMPVADEVSYEANGRQRCLPGTRTKIIRKIEFWRSSGQAQIFCLTGSSGTGKTSIACTIAASIVPGDDYYFAEFFCSSSLDKESNAMYIFPTIANTLGHKNAEFFFRLKCIEDLKKVSYAGRCEQLEKLLLEPLKALAKKTFLVIDGLDECKDDKGQDVLQALIKHVHEASLLKVLITCRSVEEIPSGLVESLCLDNDDVSSQDVDHDIRLMLIEQLQTKNFNRRAIKSIADEVVRCAQRSFMLASTVCADLKPDAGRSISQDMMADLKARLASGGSMNVLYRTFVQKAMPGSSDTHDMRLRLRLFLALSILISPSSPPLNDVAFLFELEEGDLLKFIGGFPPTVLVLSRGNHIRVRHVTFKDYINAPTSLADASLSSQCLDYHVVRLLLRFMRKNLRRNIKGSCNFVSAGGKHLFLEVKQRHDSQSLIYACCYWPRHLDRISIDRLDDARRLELLQELENFLKMKTLQWIELLMIKELYVVQSGLTKVRDWIQKYSSSSSTLQKLLADILDSLSTFEEPVLREYPLQVYHSFLLPLTPSSRRLSYVYSHVKPTVNVSAVPCHRRDMITIGPISEGSKLVMSPRGKHFAVISSNAPVEIWGTHPDEAVLLESPDNTEETVLDAVFVGVERVVVLTKSRNFLELRLWCTRTCTVQSTVLEEAAVGSSSCRGPFLTLSSDGNHVTLWRSSRLTVWEVKTMKEVRTLSPCCRHRESRILALCSRYLLYDFRLFDLKTGSKLLNVQCDLEKVTCCNFSPDGNYLAIGGDGDLVLYCIAHESHSRLLSTAIRVIGRSHVASGLTSLIFSPDGSYIISTSATQAILTVWRSFPFEQVDKFCSRGRATTGITLSAVAFQGNHGLQSVRTVCGDTSDVMLQTFDLKIPAAAQMRISALTFSSDGSRIASGSETGVVSIWNSKMTRVFRCWDGGHEGHGVAVTCVSFSPNGSFLASISPERLIIRIVSVLEDSKRCLSFLSSRQALFSVCAFSEDSSRFSVLDKDENDKPMVKIWNTGVWDDDSISFALDLPYLDGVRSIAISKQGDKFAFNSVFNSTHYLFILSVPTETSSSLLSHIPISDDSLLRGLSFTQQDRYLVSTDGCIFEITQNMKLRRVNSPEDEASSSSVDHVREIYIKNGWVVDMDNLRRCWIPQRYSCRAYASHGSSLVFCTKLGSVLFLSVPPVGEANLDSEA